MGLNSSYPVESVNHPFGGRLLPQVAQQGHSAEVPLPHGSHPLGGDASQGYDPLVDDSLLGRFGQLPGGECSPVALLGEAVVVGAQELVGIPFALAELVQRVT